MSARRPVPKAAIFRLSLYLRELERLRAETRETVSSRELGRALNLTDAQVRKDLTYFGQFGHRGVGYRVSELIPQLRHILGTDRKWNVVVLGAGNLGRALSAYRGFRNQGFNIVGLFDNDPAKIGQDVGDLTVESMDALSTTVQARDVQIAIICVPAEAAQTVTDLALRSGIPGIFNFAPVTLEVPGSTVEVSEDLAIRLEQLTFDLSKLLS